MASTGGVGGKIGRKRQITVGKEGDGPGTCQFSRTLVGKASKARQETVIRGKAHEVMKGPRSRTGVQKLGFGQ